MAYIDDITEPLIQTLTHTSGLPLHQLAGHAANLEFWACEVKHRFDVIDGYTQRFKKMRQGERTWIERQQQNSHALTQGNRTNPPLKRGIKDQELKDLRRRLTDAMYHMMERCYDEDMIDEIALDRFGEWVGFDVGEIKRAKRTRP